MKKTEPLEREPEPGIWRQTLIRMIWLTTAATVVGLAVNAWRRDPLPLFKAPAIQTAIHFREIDDRLAGQLTRSGQAILLDARQPGFYAIGHIPGAVSLPVADFEAAYASLRARDLAVLRPESTTILITYCSNRDCPDSRTLAEKLFAKGHRDIMVYAGGWEDWEGKGHESEK